MGAIAHLNELSRREPGAGEAPCGLPLAPSLYPRQPRGRHGLGGPGAGEVVANQRLRLCGAMLEAVAEHGYDALTVRELCERAQVSTRDLYGHFNGGMHECFLATFEQIADVALERLGEAQRQGGHPCERLRLVILESARAVCEEPAAARVLLLAPFAAGPCALERMHAWGERFELLLAAGLHGAGGRLRPPSPLLGKGILAGVARVARARLLVGGEHEMAGVGEQLTDWALCCAQAPPQAAILEGSFSARPYSPSAVLIKARRRGDERTRILAATATLAASEGYGGLRERQIRKAAKVSCKQFHAHFADEWAAFVGVLDLLWAGALAHASAAGQTARDWPQGLARAVSALLGCLAADPVFARLAFVEVLAAGRRGVRGRERLIGGAARRLMMSAPAGQRPSGLAAEASVAAVCAIARHRISTGETHRLAADAPMLSFIALAPAIGPHAAVQAIAGETTANVSCAAPRARALPSLSGASARTSVQFDPSQNRGGSNHPVRC